jgi:hypothetical protein
MFALLMDFTNQWRFFWLGKNREALIYPVVTLINLFAWSDLIHAVSTSLDKLTVSRGRELCSSSSRKLKRASTACFGVTAPCRERANIYTD